MMQQEHLLDFNIKGVNLRAAFVIDKDEVNLLHLYELPNLKLLNANREGDYVLHIHDRTSMVHVLKSSVLDKIQSTL
ncbi:MAG: hypothetical protein ACRC41_09265 [Sarcina sp.]